MGDAPLSAVRVLDLTRARAGPTCVRQLADWGADVIRVDPVTPNPMERPRTSADKQNLHRNKRSVGLDLKSPRGRDIFLQLAAGADVIVENMRPTSASKLGIGYEDVRRVNPRIVYGSISGYGQTGPLAGRPCFDAVMQGFGGLMSVTGTSESGPMRSGVAITDTASGLYLCMGIVTALYARERTGEGQWVTTSLLEASIGLLDLQASQWLTDGKAPVQVGNGHPVSYPVGCYRTSDGYVNIVASYGDAWQRFADALDVPDGLRGGIDASNTELRSSLDAFVCRVLASRTTREWTEVFAELGVAAGPVHTVAEVFEHPQAVQLGLTLECEGAPEGIAFLRSPVSLSASEHRVQRPAPMPGADSVDVLRELGISEATIHELVEAGVVGVG